MKVLLGSSFIVIDEEYYDVSLYHKDKKLQKNKAYIIDNCDIIKIYRGKYKDSSTLPGLYINNDTITEIEPDIGDRHKYSIDNIMELNINKIFDRLTKNESDFVRPSDIEIINNNSEVYTPSLKDDDDFLKYIVKKIIIDKKINLKNYKGKFNNHYALTNMKSGLNRSTKMTVTNFKSWCEILGVKWDMIISDSGDDSLSPLPSDIVVSSSEF